MGRFVATAPLFRGMKEVYGFAAPRRGGLELAHRDRVHRIEPTTVGIIRPGEVYRELRRAPALECEVVLIDASVLDAARSVIRRPSDPSSRGVDTLERSDPRARPLLALVRHLQTGGDPLEADVVICEAARALATLAKVDDPTRAREGAKILRARAYLRERLDQSVRLDALADHVGLDKYHLVREFRAAVGVPPYEYLTLARISRACELLRTGWLASEVATAVGFCDQSQLHRHFVRIVGTTPGRFARAFRP